MENKIDRVKVLYAVGVLLGVAAAFYFGFQLLEDLSPTTTSAVLLLGFVAFFFAGLYVEAETLDTVLYALAAGSYLVFVAYTLARFDLGDGGVFVVLAGSSALFVALGYLSSKGHLEVERRKALVGVAVVLALTVGLLAFDATGAQPTYDYDFDDEVDVPDEMRGETDIGSVTVENPFVLSRVAEAPVMNGCLYTPERETTSVRYDETPRGVLAGGESRVHGIVVRGEGFYDRDTDELRDAFADRETVPVEVAEDCPEEADEPKLVVVVTDNERASVSPTVP